MFTGNTYTFLYSKKYNMLSISTPVVYYSKPGLKRTNSCKQNLNQLYKSMSENKKNDESCISEN